MTRDVAMVGYPWNFTFEKVQLSQDLTAPVSTYDHRYLLPSNGLADGVIALYSSADTNQLPTNRYVVQGGYVLTNEDNLWADYQKDVLEAYWPGYFANFVSHALAADIAFAITKKLNTANYWHGVTYGNSNQGGVGGVYGKARNLDSYHSPPNNRMTDFPLVSARIGGVGSWPSSS